MKFEITSNTLDKISADALLLFAFSQQASNSARIFLTEGFYNIDKILKGFLQETLNQEEFKAKEGEIIGIPLSKKLLIPKVFVLGLGDKNKFNGNILRKAMAVFSANIKNKTQSVSLIPLLKTESNLETNVLAQSISEGFLLGAYTFNKYKKQEEGKKTLETIIISEPNKNTALKIKEGVKRGETFAKAVTIARDLVNEPSFIVNPTFLANMAKDIARKNPQIKCAVYEKEELEKMGMNAFLGVARGADTPPKFIYLEYLPAGRQASQDKKTAIVGKGITFDSGGVSIKPGDAMKDMKIDMAGAAAVLGVFSVISEIKPKHTVLGLIAATPNLISGKSIVPGDVVRAYNGKTIEILNTDAEGRVTLADSLSFAVKKGASEIVDLATLTGACEVALGTDIAGLFSNNDILKDKIKQAAGETGEKIWELPLANEYKELNKSEVADISNIPSSRYGGAITAALFLEEFIDNKPWVHLDIAGPAYQAKAYDLGPKGGTGFGVRLVLEYLTNT